MIEFEKRARLTALPALTYERASTTVAFPYGAPNLRRNMPLAAR